MVSAFNPTQDIIFLSLCPALIHQKEVSLHGLYVTQTVILYGQDGYPGFLFHHFSVIQEDHCLGLWSYRSDSLFPVKAHFTRPWALLEVNLGIIPQISRFVSPPPGLLFTRSLNSTRWMFLLHLMPVSGKRYFLDRSFSWRWSLVLVRLISCFWLLPTPKLDCFWMSQSFKTSYVPQWMRKNNSCTHRRIYFLESFEGYMSHLSVFMIMFFVLLCLWTEDCWIQWQELGRTPVLAGHGC